MQNFLISGLLLTTPLLLAAIGDLYAEKSGELNLGIEASMIIGAYAAYHASFATGNAYVGLLAAIVAGLLIGAINALFLVRLRCSQVVYGVAINILGLGITSTLFRMFFDVSNGYQKSPGLPRIVIPGLADIPFIGPVLSSQTLLSYVAVVFLAVTIVVFRSTTIGLKIKAVGEHPHAADSLGVDVQLVRSCCLLVSGVFGALGGAALTIGALNYFQDGMTAGRGYVALAAIIFGRYTPLGLLAGVLLFGMANAFQLRMQVLGLHVPYHLFLAIPYVATILAMFIMGPSTAPAGSGVPFLKGKASD